MSKNAKKTYILTAAQSFARPNKRFLASLDQLAEHLSAEIIILPMIGSSAREDWDIENMNPKLRDYDFEYGQRSLNSNISIDQFNIRPYQIDPLTGLERFTQRETSKIFASPKQRLKYVPHSNRKMPKALITPGAVTKPNYATSHDTSAERRRLGDIARRDHVYGAWVVEVMDDSYYHHRNVRSLANGTLVDLGIKFDPDNDPTHAKLDALVFGDWHVGYTDKKVREANYRMIKDFSPERIFLHDYFNGHSVSHHMAKELIYQMIREGSDKGHLSLDDELKACNKELWRLAEAMANSEAHNGGEIVVVYSNHCPKMLERYLDEGRFVKDALNARMALELAIAYANEENPVEAGIRAHGDLPENVRFMEMNEDYKVHGYQLASHGDTGPADGRGSLKTKECDFGKSITGHVHQGGILRDTYTVGTSLPLYMFYMRNNPSAWSNTHGLLWDTGTVQLVNIVHGSYSRADANR